MASQIDIQVDKDIEDLCQEITEIAKPWNLVLFNDDHTPMLVAILAIGKALIAMGVEANINLVVGQMLEAHTNEHSIVWTGDKEIVEKGLVVLKSYKLNSMIELN